MFDLELYERKTFQVSAVKVTEVNMEEVAAWCKGRILETYPDYRGRTRKFIQVPVRNALSNRRKQAFIGDRVSVADGSFMVYTRNAFEMAFDRVDKTPEEIEKELSSNEFLQDVNKLQNVAGVLSQVKIPHQRLAKAIETTNTVGKITDIFMGGDDETRVAKVSPKMNGMRPGPVFIDEVTAWG